MGRAVVIAIWSVVIGPIIAGVAVAFLTPWLQQNAAAIAPIVTSWWLLWLLYGVSAAAWLYYWLVIVARRMAPASRRQRINDLFREQEAIRRVVVPDTSPVWPSGLRRRVDRLYNDAINVMGSDLVVREFLSATFNLEQIYAEN